MQLRKNTLAAAVGLAATVVSALGNEWTLSCGSTCDDLAAVDSGDYSSGTQTCKSFASGYEYCYLNVTDSAPYGLLYSWISEGADCLGTEAQEDTFDAGVCAEVTDYQSYIVVLEI